MKNSTVARAIAAGARAKHIQHVARPFVSPGLWGSKTEDDPGVWVTMNRRVTLASHFPVGRRVVVWAVDHGVLHYATVDARSVIEEPGDG